MSKFTIKLSRYRVDYLVYLPNDNMLARIRPYQELSGKYSKEMLEICYFDGKTEIAYDLDHAADLITKKHFS